MTIESQIRDLKEEIARKQRHLAQLEMLLGTREDDSMVEHDEKWGI